MIHSDSNDSKKSGDNEEPLNTASLDLQNPQKSNKQVELDFCLFEKGPKAAKRFNDLIAKTLKLQE